MIRRLATIGFTWGLLASFAPGQSPGPATGTVQGEVFTTDADGGRSVLTQRSFRTHVPESGAVLVRLGDPHKKRDPDLRKLGIDHRELRLRPASFHRPCN
jgi:hypothetical protein